MGRWEMWFLKLCLTPLEERDEMSDVFFIIQRWQRRASPFGAFVQLSEDRKRMWEHILLSKEYTRTKKLKSSSSSNSRLLTAFFCSRHNFWCWILMALFHHSLLVVADFAVKVSGRVFDKVFSRIIVSLLCEYFKSFYYYSTFFSSSWCSRSPPECFKILNDYKNLFPLPRTIWTLNFLFFHHQLCNKFSTLLLLNKL